MFRGLTDAQLGQVCPVWDRWAPAPPKRIVCSHGTTCELIVETTLTGPAIAPGRRSPSALNARERVKPPHLLACRGLLAITREAGRTVDACAGRPVTCGLHQLVAPL